MRQYVKINKIVEENELVASQRRNASLKAMARARAAAWDKRTTSCWRPGRLGLPGGHGPGRAALRAYLVYGVINGKTRVINGVINGETS